ncbi:MAG: hypothetical protein WCI74_06040 [Actinomycetes bacterium]
MNSKSVLAALTSTTHDGGVNVEQATYEVFAPLVGECFRVRFEADSPDGPDYVELELTSADLSPVPDGAMVATREPFSLIFHGDVDHPLEQRTYAVAHESLGETDIFLVPIGPSEKGMGYQAVFG